MLSWLPWNLIYLAVALVALSVAFRHTIKKFRVLLPSKKLFVKNIIQAMGNAGDGGFDSLLGLDDAEIIGFESGELTLRYTVPVNLSMISCICEANGSAVSDTNGEIGVGAVLALADVFTTIALLAGDSNHRPGVSISLSGEVFKKISVGQVIVIKAKILKIGANLGFTEMWVHDDTNEPLARAKHVKYLQMGVIWDMYGFLLPLIVNLYNFTKSTGKKSVGSETSRSAVAAIFSESIFQKQASNAEKPWYYLHADKKLQNFYGFMHGGAICCLLELCIVDSFMVGDTFPLLADPGESTAADGSNAASRKDDKKKFKAANRNHGGDPLRYLEVSFLSPCKGSLEVGIEHHSLGIEEVKVHANSTTRGGESAIEIPKGCLVGKIYSVKDKKKNRILVEASYSY